MMGGPYGKLTLGTNLHGFGASVNMRPGEALLGQDVLWRHDGAAMKHWGWERKDFAGVVGRPLALKGFAYKGKNSPDARDGNFGVANDGAGFTKRAGFYGTAILLTDQRIYYWNPATPGWAAINDALNPDATYSKLPNGVSIDPAPKPTILIRKDCAYIVGWCDENLRYDPVDRILYRWGWDQEPNATGVLAAGAGLAPGTYRYWASWINLFTGEESALDEITFGGNPTVTATAANGTVNITLRAYGVDAGGFRHYNDGAARANEDVGIVIYRSDPNEAVPYFLTIINPDVTAAAPDFQDTGALGLAYSTRGDTRAFEDPPRLNHFCEFATQWYGISWDNNFARIYWNDFAGISSFWERWDVRNYKEAPLSDGETLMSMLALERSMVAFSNVNAYEVDSNNGKVTRIDSLKWSVGCIAPKASFYVNNWVHFIADRGPYRWRPGMLEPEFIGEPVSPLFVEPTTGLCSLSEMLRDEAEIVYDQDARHVRYIFACGPGTTQLNRHISWWVDAAEKNGDAKTSWVIHSTQPQCLDMTNQLAPAVGGLPVDPFERRARMCFGEYLEGEGYTSEYNPQGAFRGGLPPGVIASGVVDGGTVAVLATPGGLFTTDDGMKGMRLELYHPDGTIDVRTIASNTGTNITPSTNFSAAPTAGQRWYVGGYPSLWRSWVDHMGQPTVHKDLVQLYMGQQRFDVSETTVLDLTISASSEWPLTVSRTRTVQLDQYRDKQLVALVGRYFTYEFANSRPDETFVLTFLETEEHALGGRRK